MDLKKAFGELKGFIKDHAEMLLIFETGQTFSLKSEEIETCVDRGRIMVSLLDDRGIQTWRVKELKTGDAGIFLALSRNFGTEIEKIRIAPRISVAELCSQIEIARIERANQVARLIGSEFENLKLIRVQLNKENGRFAQIIVEQNRLRIAVLADVSETAAPEVCLSNAINWLAKLELRKKHPIGEIWIIAEKRTARNLQKLHALLNESWKRKIKIYDLNEQNVDKKIVRRKTLVIKDLWREKPGKVTLIEKENLSQTALEIIGLAPEKIDCISMKSGESLRFHGLRFARVRKTFGTEKCWFGIERDRRILSARTFEEFEKMIGEFEAYRRFDSPYKRHEYFRMSPEAWLETILRRNIKLLDANLILSPIYNQFRASNDKIDLLALRRDGRLVIIELKVSSDREMIFQGLEYWRKVELQRRKGVLNAAKIFGDLEIADKPTIVYLVAPTLSFHRDFRSFGSAVSPEIDICRFDLAENWRENLKVLRREELNSPQSSSTNL